MGEVEFRETLTAPKKLRRGIYAGFVAIVGFFLVFPFFTQGANDLLHLFLSILFAAVALTVHIFFSLQVRVNGKGVEFGFYGFKKEFSYKEIVDCAVIPYTFADFPGFGIVRGHDGCTMYNVPGDGHAAVKIVVLEEKRGKVEYAFSSRRPQQIVRKIQHHLRRKSLPPKHPFEKKFVASRMLSGDRGSSTAMAA